MNEKIREIEERWEDDIKEKDFYMNADNHEEFQIAIDVDDLLSYIKELENNIPDPEWCCTAHKAELVKKIKELEEENKRLNNLYDLELTRVNKAENDHFQALLRIKELEENELRFPTMAEFSNLQDDYEKVRSKMKELEEKFNNQVEMRNKLTIIKFELEERVKKLEEGIEKLKFIDNHPSSHEDYVSAKRELYKLVMKL